MASFVILGVPEERTVVDDCASTATVRRGRARRLVTGGANSDCAAREFLFYPAQFWPHKNHLRLIEAFRELWPRSWP